MTVQAIPHRFELINDTNHPVIPVNGYRVCIDTGSPFTFKHPRGPASIRLFERDLQLPEVPVAPGTMEAGSELLGFHFDVLLGMDQMFNLAWRLDWRAGTAEAAPALPEEPGTTWVDMPPVMPGFAMSCPSCHVNAGREVALFDTGAQLSYRVGTTPASARQVERTRDFNPHLGVFETPVWEDELEVGGYQIPIRFGRLPQSAPRVLETLGVSWVLGSDLLRAFRVTLNFPARRLGLRLQKESR